MSPVRRLDSATGWACDCRESPAGAFAPLKWCQSANLHVADYGVFVGCCKRVGCAVCNNAHAVSAAVGFVNDIAIYVQYIGAISANIARRRQA